MSELLPSGWFATTLGELAVRVTDGTHQSPGFVDSGVPFLVIGNVVDGKIDWSSVHKWVTPKTYEECTARCRPQRGDVLYTAVGSYGTALVVDTDERFMFQRHIAHIKPRPDIVEPGYLAASLNGPALRRRADDVARGVAQKTVTLGALKGFPLRLPPLNEQRRIVAKLEALQARSRRARAALDGVPPLLEKLRQSILAAAFRGDLTKDWRAKHKDVEPASELLKRIRAERRRKWEEAELARMTAKGKAPKDDEWKAKYKEPEPVDVEGLPELPEGWCWASVEEAGQVDLGRMRSPDKHRGENVCQYLRVKNVYEDRIDVSDVMEMQFEPAEFEFYRLIPGDIVLNEGQSKELVGRPAMFRGELPNVAFTNSLLRFRPYGALPKEYALALFRHYLHSGRFQQIAQITTNIAHLGASRLRALEYPVAPAKEQVAIASVVTDLLARVGVLEKPHEVLCERSSSLDRALLAKAFRGELVPQDPNDEPVEVMLARVRGANGSLETEPSRSAGARRERATKGNGR